MRKILLAVCLALLGTAALPLPAGAHPERQTAFPDQTRSEVPEVRHRGRSIVVCKPDAAQRIRESWRGRGPVRTRVRAKRLRMLDRCAFEHIQQAVDAARSGTRILVMPGVYREEPSRAIPVDDPRCPAGDPTYWQRTEDGHGIDGRVPTYRFHLDCPNARNLIQVLGDPDATNAPPQGGCVVKCDLQILGMGRQARDTLVVGDRRKPDVLRADRADGFVVGNIATEQAEFNGIDIVETNGFRIEKLVSRFNQSYGVLTFTSDNGLYDNVEAYANGDSGIYPGSGPEGRCERYGIVVQDVRSYANVLGYSGTAGNGTWVRDSQFHDNAAGISTDSFASGHPGMPQDCSKWTGNDVYSNNVNVFADNGEQCRATSFEERPRELVCPQFQVPVGSGFLYYGANRNIVRDNRIWDNWRSGLRLFYVPAAIRGEIDLAKQFDTSNANAVVDNLFGVASDGSRAPNGEDVTWDAQGIGNCWQANRTAPGVGLTSSPSRLPGCASGGSTSLLPNPLASAAEVPCASWDPDDNPAPLGCTWFTTPPPPRP